MPAPKPKPPALALRQALALARDPIAALCEQQRRQGDPFCLKFPSVGRIYFTGHPEGAEQIFRAGRSVFEPPDFNPVAPVLGDHSLILLKGERHRLERKLMMPFFAGERMRAYSDVIAELTREEIGAWAEGRELCAFELARSIILQVIFQGIFGVRERALRERFKSAVVALLRSYTTPLAIFPFLRRPLAGVGPWSAFLRRRAAFDAMLLGEIHARRASGLEGRSDILSLLMGARYDDGTLLSDGELIDEIRTLLVGGHDTSSSSLAWAFYQVLSVPRVRAGIEEELASLGPDPSPAALAELPYLGAVCDEILRLYPPVPFALRRACEPFTLRGVELEPGDNLAIAMVVLHRNPGVFEQPDAFLPERFLARKYSPFELAPFGGGMRRCIGAAFGAHALRIAIGTVLLHADIELARPLEVSAVTHNITIGPDRRIPLVRQGPGRALR